MYVKYCGCFTSLIVLATIATFITSCVYTGYIDISRPVLRNCTIYNYTITRMGPLYIYDIIIVNDVKAQQFIFQTSDSKEIEYYDNLINQTSFDCFYKNNGKTELIFRKPKSYSKETAEYYSRVFWFIFVSLALISFFLMKNCCIKFYDRYNCYYWEYDDYLNSTTIYDHTNIKNYMNQTYLIIYKKGVKLPADGDIFGHVDQTNLIFYDDNRDIAVLNSDFQQFQRVQNNQNCSSVAVNQNIKPLLQPPLSNISNVLKVQKHMKKAYAGTDCMICTDEMKEDEELEAFIPCQHAVHAVCRNEIEKCPVCGNV